jgi:hypothetical protein
MKTRNLLILFIAFVLVFVALVPAPVRVEAASTAAKNDGTVKYKIVNNAKEKVVFQLYGRNTYTKLVKPQQSATLDVVPGKYTYIMNVCDTRVSGKLEITNKKTQSFRIERCAIIGFDNRTGAPLYITLKGPATYYISVPVTSTFSFIIPGTYQYTVVGCSGKTIKGTKIVKKASIYR